MSKTRFGENGPLGERAAFTIFNQLSLTDLKSAKLVCRDWRSVIEETIWPINYQPITVAFEKTAELFPDSTFIQFYENCITYQQANQTANKLAHHLVGLGLPHESRVAVYLPNSPSLIITMLAIWKAGLVYFPLPKHEDIPQPRLLSYVKDCKPSTLITTRSHEQDTIVAHMKAQPKMNIIMMDKLGCIADVSINRDALPRTNVNREIAPNQLAYIIYTSGSDKAPKGVEIEHKGLLRSIKANADIMKLDHNDKILQVSAASFDAHIMEIGLPFVTQKAAMLYIMPRTPTGTISLKRVARVCKSEKITISIMTPSMLVVQDPEYFTSVRAIISTGEKLFESVINKWAGNRMFLNGYGPSEVTICTSIGADGTHVGKAIPGLEVFLADVHNDERYDGECELLIGGDGVGRGYSNNDVLTQDKFIWIKDPRNPQREVRVYKTGDIVKMDKDGNIDYVRRIDTQLKIHGKLIRLEEIQHVLEYFNQEFYVHVGLMKFKDANKYPAITAYLFADVTSNVQIEKLWNHLRAMLPSDMFPSLWCILPRALYQKCLSVNKKVNDQLLAEVLATDNIRPHYQVGYSRILPRDDIEKEIAEIWCSVLKIDKQYFKDDLKSLYIDSNFFQLGGTSIFCVSMLNRVEDKYKYDGFDGEVCFEDFMRHPTIAHLARIVRRCREDKNIKHAVLKISSFDLLKPVPRIAYPIWMPASLMGAPNTDYKIFVKQFKDKKRPIYGLRAYGVRDELAVVDNLTEMASYHLREVYEYQEHEPYIFVGWSGGGLVAYEMARLAQSHGKDAYAVMIDSECPISLNARTNQAFAEKYFYRLLRDKQLQSTLIIDDRIVAKIKISLDGAVSNNTISKKELSHLFFTELSHAVTTAYHDQANKTYDDDEEVRHANYLRACKFIAYLRGFFNAVLSANLQPLQNGVTLVAAEASRNQLNERLGWPEEYKMNVIPVKGNHFNIMLEPEDMPDYSAIIARIQTEACAKLLETNDCVVPLPVNKTIGQHHIPALDTKFIRHDKSEKLQTSIVSANNYGIHTVCGEPGMGKTSIVQSCIYSFLKTNHFTKIFWINCANGLVHEFVSLARYLKISTQNNIDETLKNIWTLLKKERVLMVIDNVTDTQALFEKQYISPGEMPAVLQVIVATKNEIVKGSASQMEVGVFSPEQSIAFLQEQFSKFRHLYDEEAAASICSNEMLGGHPLALSISASHMCQAKMPMTQYVKVFGETKYIPLKKSDGSDVTDKVTYKAIVVILNQIKKDNPEAFEVLQLCSFFNTPVIPKAWLSFLLKLDDGRGKKFEELLFQLQLRALITHDKGATYIRVHTLIQECLLEMMSAKTSQRCINLIINSLIEVYSNDEHDIHPFKRNLYVLAKLFCQRFMSRGDIGVSDSIYVYCLLANYVCEVEQIDYTQADIFITNAIQLCKETSDTFIPLYRLQIIQASVKSGLGDSERAKEICTELLANKALGATEIEKVNFIMGNMFYIERNTAQARKYLILAPKNVRARSHLGVIEFCSLRLRLAVEHFEEALCQKEAGQQISDLEFADLLMTYAPILAQDGKGAKARQKLDEATTIYEKHFGNNNHPKLLELRSSYAYCCHQDGLLALAKEKLLEARTIKDILVAMYGIGVDSDTIISYTFEQELALLYMSLNMFGDARKQLDKLGKVSHNNRNPIYQVLCGNYEMQMGNFDAAKKFYDTALSLRLGMGEGRKTHEYFYCRLLLAGIPLAQQDIPEAERLYREILEEGRATKDLQLRRSDKRTLLVFEVKLLLAQERGEEALDKLLAVMPEMEREYDKKSCHLYRLKLLVLKAKLACDDFDHLDIIHELEWLLAKQAPKVFGSKKHLDIVETLQCLAKAHEQQGNMLAAIIKQQTAVEMLQKLFKDTPASTFQHELAVDKLKKLESNNLYASN